MTKKIFIDVRGIDWEAKKRYITYAIEKNFDGIVADADDLEKIKKLGKINVISENLNSDYVLTSDEEVLKRLDKKKAAFYKKIENKDDERAVVFMKNFADYFFIETGNWKIIPLENLIAEVKNGIIAIVKNFEDAITALRILEKGCDGVAITTLDISEIKKISEYINKTYKTTTLNLSPVKITTIKKLDIGDRVCIDTASMLKIGEGMLVGSQSNGLFLVHSETLESEYVNSRPFRVNAGAVASYILCPDGKTKYLSEIKAGDEMLAVDFNGNTRKVYVVRVKIESRPLILIEASGRIDNEERIIKILLQNAETIRLVNKEGKPVSITELKEGDEVLAYLEEGGRHFGTKVDETIIER